MVFAVLNINLKTLCYFLCKYVKYSRFNDILKHIYDIFTTSNVLFFFINS